jgi:uncharacterized protein
VSDAPEGETAELTDADELEDEFDDDVAEDGDEDEVDGNTITAGNARSVLDYLVRAVVDDPDSVEVEIEEGGRRPALNVTVAPGDMGRVIGKRGRVATAIRTVTRSAAVRDGVEVDIEFLD